MGTGSTLALLPAENATGNFVKVVQRLPVRIDLIDYNPDVTPLFIGLSVTPYVHIYEKPTGPNAGKFLQASLASRTSAPSSKSTMTRRSITDAICQAIGRSEPLADRCGGGDPDLHGGAGHDHRQRRSALHRRRLVGRERGQRVGHHQLSRGERDHPADFGLARDCGSAGGIIFSLRSRFSPWPPRCAGWPVSLTFIIAARVLQGVAGGGLQPSSQAILLDAFPQEKQGQAMTVFGMAALLAPVVGPTLGGYITDNYGWRWIFYLNVPVGLLAFFMCRALVQDPEYLQAERAKTSRQAGALRYVGALSVERDHGLLGDHAEQGTGMGLVGRSVPSRADAGDFVCARAGRLDLSRTASAQSTDRSADARRSELPRVLHHYLLRVRRALRQYRFAARLCCSRSLATTRPPRGWFYRRPESLRSRCWWSSAPLCRAASTHAT